ncbi:MAG: PD-(D/E)XK nuclease family protein, partial [Candidatus Thermoplasmatota archaeon]|nr:PD-(D/E)XK nuclease family protein [Candidatus Thermoplasmatota archaeon]
MSASGLTTYLRCPRQWYLTRKVGLSSPSSIGQITGLVIEDALCRVLMHRPGPMDSFDALRSWAYDLCQEEAENAWSEGEVAWNARLWKRDDSDWPTVEVSDYESKIRNGVDLFLEEVEACYNQNGGPYLETYRSGSIPFRIPSPTWGNKPYFPVPEKIRSLQARDWSVEHAFEWQSQDEEIQWNEAWEIARPWFKDPRVHQPQRMFHPEGWAAGELDLVVRWDGNVRLIDIKSGHSGSTFSESLQHQLRFYAWLWSRTKEEGDVQSMEGWYLSSKERIDYKSPSKEELTLMDEEFLSINETMRNMGEGASQLPANSFSGTADHIHACNGEGAGCGWCSVSSENLDSAGPMNEKTRAAMIQGVNIQAPCSPFSEIPSRVDVSGELIAQWGPLPNHFNEPVLGAMLKAGEATIAIEEAEPGAFPSLHDSNETKVVIRNALPGVWRDQPRLYVDAHASIEPQSEEMVNSTRIGLLRTRANVEGLVLSIRRQNGTRLDGRPWSMLAFHLWDGSHVVEVVAFGSAINDRLLSLQPGETIRLIG